MFLRVVFFSLLVCLSACTRTAEPVGSSASPVIYGTDDRHDAYEETDPGLRELAQKSVVALIPTYMFNTSNPSNYTLYAETIGEAYNLCEGERYTEEPRASMCSGVLIDDDLVLTAGHCVDEQVGGVWTKSLAVCRSYYFTFDFYNASSGTLANISRAQDIYTCQEILAYRNTDSLDYAVVRIDRRATPNGKIVAPTRTDRTALPLGMHVTAIGFPSGMPLKIADDGIIKRARPRTLDYFQATLDTFGGNSGSGVFDATGTVVGVLVRGQTDYAGSPCKRARVLSSSTEDAEDVTYVHRAIDALCDSGARSARLCGTPDECGDGSCTGSETESSCVADCFVHRCGDGICGGAETTTSCATDCVTYRCGDGTCNGPETTTNCPVDCVTTRCGDGICNVHETPATCAADCVVTAAPVVPAEWTCPDALYNARNNCDCTCGVYDPDCNAPGATVDGCGANEICTNSATCLRVIDSAWTCAVEIYNAGDACDCGCGAYDPDCDDPNLEVLNCSGVCNSTGGCEVGTVGNDGGAPMWACANNEYADGTTCNCRCGIYDPDCANPNLPVLRCPDDYACSSDAECTLSMSVADLDAGVSSHVDGGRIGSPVAGSGGDCTVGHANKARDSSAIAAFFSLACASLFLRRRSRRRG